MRRLHAFALSPSCRRVRLSLAEKGLGVDLKETPPWEASQILARLDARAAIPTLIDGSFSIWGAGPICEYLEERYADAPLLRGNAFERAEARRLVCWADDEFGNEVSAPLLGERVLKRFAKTGEPDSAKLRAGLNAMQEHLAYLDRLAHQRRWLAGDSLSLADFAAAAHLSCLDYLGLVRWEGHSEAKAWYSRLKSRPGFQGLLADYLPGLPPSAEYTALDF